ncbi:hypothetical protein GDO81_012129 [Engystomops pustulosus]|uniref:NIDO domain-containing protein n=1 Tax=Engystomops pustulosus TaxID=76066 RepID=A0AAV7BJT2_ENGPU|nr:hypothetical protein GDO81_012129 [Engystomops pustulosus]
MGSTSQQCARPRRWGCVCQAARTKQERGEVNTFQAVLSTDETNTFIMYNYADIQWITGTNADGDLEGLSYDVPGRTPALAGGNSGQTDSYFKIPASLTSSMMNITSTSNVDVPGRWVFKVDRMEVMYPNMTQSKCTLD